MATNPQTTNIPPYGPMVNAARNPEPVWYSFFLTLANALSGGTTGIIISGNNFSPQAANTILAGPPSGGATKPAFRVLESGDLSSVAGALPAVSDASVASSNAVGFYASASVTTPVALTSVISADIAALPLAPGDWDVWGSFGTSPAGGASQTLLKAWLNTVSATDPNAPNGGAYLSRGISAGEGAAQFGPIGMMQLSLGSATTVFLSANVAFSGGTVGGVGFIGARRRR